MEFIIKVLSSFVKTNPMLALIVGVLLFIGICLANWNKSIRKKVNYFLSFREKDENQAHATAQGRLHLLNAILIFISIMLIIFSLAVFGI